MLTRERREHRVFNHLLHMVPELQKRLTDASTEEIVHIGELVSPVMYSHLLRLFVIDTEGFCQCEVGRHEELEKCDPRLDYTSGSIS
jgi:hypothetical protein